MYHEISLPFVITPQMKEYFLGSHLLAYPKDLHQNLTLLIILGYYE